MSAKPVMGFTMKTIRKLFFKHFIPINIVIILAILSIGLAVLGVMYWRLTQQCYDQHLEVMADCADELQNCNEKWYAKLDVVYDELHDTKAQLGLVENMVNTNENEQATINLKDQEIKAKTERIESLGNDLVSIIN